MKVGISGYVGNKLTGIGRVLVNVLEELAKQYPKDQYVLFKNFDFDDYEELKKYKNIQIVNYKVSENSPIGNIVWHQYSFQKLLKEYHCDLAYIPNFTLLLWKRIPTIVTIHDLIEFNVPDKFSKSRMLYRKIIDPLMTKNSTFILTVSQCSKNDIINYCNTNKDKILVTPNAADRNKFRKYDNDAIDSCLNKYGLRRNGYFVFVGTIDFPGKNIKTVIEAFFNLKRKNGISEQLVIVGKDGHNSQIIYDYVNSSEYKNDVIFTGYLPDDDLPLFYSGAKIMIYLSLYEGFGLPVLEAMSCGTAVICPNTSCFPEVVAGLDVSVTPTDVNAVENKILKISENSLFREKLSEECYLRADQYSWKISAQLYYDVFKKYSKNDK